MFPLGEQPLSRKGRETHNDTEAAQLQVGHPGSLGSLWCPVQQEWTWRELSSKPSPLLSSSSAQDLLQPQGHLSPAGIRQLTQQCVHPQLFPLQKESRNTPRPCCPQKEGRDESLHSWGRAWWQNRGAAQALAPSALCVA